MSSLNLPDMQKNVPLVATDGTPSFAFHRWWMSVVKSLKETFDNLQETVTAIEAALNAANIAVAASATAVSAANTATSAANASTSVSSLTNSGVTGVTITGTDAGSNVTVSVSAHSRVYGNGTTVSVNSGNVPALAYSTVYYIYYDQPSRLGGTVTYLATTSETTAVQIGDRHLVGSVLTPAALGAPTDGKSVRPPGLGNIES